MRSPAPRSMVTDAFACASASQRTLRPSGSFAAISGRCRTGFTLVEILVALAVTLLLMMAAVTLFATISRGVTKNVRDAEQIQRLSHARDLLEADLTGITAFPSKQGYSEFLEYYRQDADNSGVNSHIGDWDDVLAFTSHNENFAFSGIMGQTSVVIPGSGFEGGTTTTTTTGGPSTSSTSTSTTGSTTGGPTFNPLYLDFGAASSPVESGYVRVSPSTSYSSSPGYGWMGTLPLAADRSSPVTSALNRDLCYAPDMTFVADVPPGTYDVTITIGDVASTIIAMEVLLEGAIVGNVPPQGNNGPFYNQTFSVNVTDGQLTLRVKNTGSGNAKINGLTIVQTASATTTTGGGTTTGSTTTTTTGGTSAGSTTTGGSGTTGGTPTSQVTVFVESRSRNAEVIWFVSDNVLYRRVLPILPGGSLPNLPKDQFYANYAVSARETTPNNWVLNSLDDLQQRRNRHAHGTADPIKFSKEDLINNISAPSVDRLGTIAVLDHVVGFDMKVYDPGAPIISVVSSSGGGSGTTTTGGTSTTTGGSTTTTSTTGSTTGGPTFASLYLDFGTAGSPVESGYVRVSNTAYSPSPGYGWLGTLPTPLDRGTSPASTALKRDLCYAPDMNFVADVPPGTYDVTVTIGDITSTIVAMDVMLEGVTVGNVPVQGTANATFYTQTFSVSVTDGQLNLRVKSTVSGNAKINGLTIVQTASAPSTTGTSSTSTTGGTTTGSTSTTGAGGTTGGGSPTRVTLIPGDPGYSAAISSGQYQIVGYGAYVDLPSYDSTGAVRRYLPTTYAPPAGAPAPQFNGEFNPNSGLPATAGEPGIYDTWGPSYEDIGADGLDNDNNGIVDDETATQANTAPPYAQPLPGIQVKIRVYDPVGRTVREVTVRKNFQQ